MNENNNGNNNPNNNLNQGNNTNLGTINTDFLNTVPDSKPQNNNTNYNQSINNQGIVNQNPVINPNQVNNFTVPPNNNINNIPPIQNTNNQPVTPNTNNKSKGKTIILVIIIILLIVLFLAFCYIKFIKFTPKGIFVNGIDNIYKETNNKINDLPEVGSKNKFNGSLSINSDDETLSKYSNYKLVYSGEIDSDNHNYKIALGLNDDTHDGNDAELAYVNNKYYITLNKEYYDKTIQYESDSSTTSDINSYLNNSVSINDTSALKDANKILKNTIVKNISSLKYNIGIESINGKNYNYSETLVNNKTLNDILDNIKKDLDDNSDFNDTLKKAIGIDYNKFKEQFKDIEKEMDTDNTSSNDKLEYSIKIYYTGDIIPDTKGFSISDDNDDNNKMLFILDNKDIYSEIDSDGSKILVSGTTSNIKVTENDKEIATLKINSFKANNIDLEYKLSNISNNSSSSMIPAYINNNDDVSGSLKLTTNNKKTTFSLSMNYKNSDDEDNKLTINGDYSYDSINSVSINEDNVIDYNSLSEEDMNTILNNITSSSRPVAQILSSFIGLFNPSSDTTTSDDCYIDADGTFICN